MAPRSLPDLTVAPRAEAGKQVRPGIARRKENQKAKVTAFDELIRQGEIDWVTDPNECDDICQPMFARQRLLRLPRSPC
jgi:hypothetical protein